jgi:hypothetical protein
MNWSAGLDCGVSATRRGLDPRPAVRRIEPAETTNAVDARQDISQLPNAARRTSRAVRAFYQEYAVDNGLI